MAIKSKKASTDIGTMVPAPIITTLPSVPAESIARPTVQRPPKYALGIMGLSMFFGVWFLYFFFDRPLGISYPIFMGCVLSALWLLGKKYRTNPTKLSYLWLIPMVFFSLMISVRESELLTVLNIGVSFYGVLVFVWMNASLEEKLTYDIRKILLLPIAFMANWFATFASLRKWWSISASGSPTVMADHGKRNGIIKGILFSIPLIILYLVLFSTGDLVFRGAMEAVGQWFSQFHFFSLPEISFARLWIFFLAMLGIGGLLDAHVSKMAFLYRSQSSKVSIRKLGYWESTIPLVVVNLIFLVFTLLQLKYFLSGYGAIGPEGFTYAEYAKKGYFELSFAAAISFLIIFLVGRESILQEGKLHRNTKFLCIGLTLQILFVMWCAYSRLDMYQMAYGLTLDRFYGYVFLIWMLWAMLWLAWKTWTDEAAHRYLIGMVAWCMFVLAGVNIINPAGLVAWVNLDRISNQQVLQSVPMLGQTSVPVDYKYLWTLGVDAVPTLAKKMSPDAFERLVSTLGEYDPIKGGDGPTLLWQVKVNLRKTEPSLWFTFHFGRYMAAKALGVGD